MNEVPNNLVGLDLDAVLPGGGNMTQRDVNEALGFGNPEPTEPKQQISTLLGCICHGEDPANLSKEDRATWERDHSNQ